MKGEREKVEVKEKENMRSRIEAGRGGCVGVVGRPTWYRQRKTEKYEANNLSDGKITKALENYKTSV